MELELGPGFAEGLGSSAEGEAVGIDDDVGAAEPVTGLPVNVPPDGTVGLTDAVGALAVHAAASSARVRPAERAIRGKRVLMRGRSFRSSTGAERRAALRPA
jgi:hypothetical protein